MTDSRPPVDPEQLQVQPNPYEPPASTSMSEEISVARHGVRLVGGLLFGAIAGGLGGFTTCGGIGLASVTVFGLYSKSPFLPILIVAAYVTGIVVGLMLFLKVFRAFVLPKKPQESHSSNAVVQTISTNEKSP